MEGYWKDRGVTYELSDLSRSVFSTLGLSDSVDVLKLGASPAGRECILLVDGMGKNAIDLYGQRFPHIHSLKNLECISATFPSTTATSLTSLGTGSRAGEHGMVGYTMRVPHSGRPERVLNALKWDERVDPLTWQPLPTLFERATQEGISVTSVAAKRYENTGFTRAALRGGNYRGANLHADLISEAVKALAKERSFVYLYLNDVDEASHSDGLGSDKFFAAMARVDLLIGELKGALPPGTRLWITSDHGMINREEFVVLGKENSLLDGVDLLAGEPRVRYLYAEHSRISGIRARWEDFFGAKVTILSRQDAIDHGLFGPTVLDSVRERIGDLVAIANEKIILVEPDREALQCAMVGHHGGTTSDELEIPLLTFQT